MLVLSIALTYAGLATLAWYFDVSFVLRSANIAVLAGQFLALSLVGWSLHRLRPSWLGLSLSGITLYAVLLTMDYARVWLQDNAPPETEVATGEYCARATYWHAYDMPYQLEVYRRSPPFDVKIAVEQVFGKSYYDPQPDTPASRALLMFCRDTMPDDSFPPSRRHD